MAAAGDSTANENILYREEQLELAKIHGLRTIISCETNLILYNAKISSDTGPDH